MIENGLTVCSMPPLDSIHIPVSDVVVPVWLVWNAKRLDIWPNRCGCEAATTDMPPSGSTRLAKTRVSPLKKKGGGGRGGRKKLSTKRRRNGEGKSEGGDLPSHLSSQSPVPGESFEMNHGSHK